MSRSLRTEPYHHGDLRSALVAAATRLVRAKGAAQVSLREIAREAGVSHAAPYHHFEDREAILAEVAVVGFQGLGDSLRQGAAATSDASPMMRLQGAGVAYVRFAVENPAVYRLMFGGLLSDRRKYPGLKAAADAAFGALVELLREGGRSEDAQAFNPVALTAWSTVHGLGSLVIEGILADETEAVPVDEIARAVTLVLGRGLRSYADPAVPPEGGV